MKPLTIREAAESLGVHPATVWRLVRLGSLPALRIGRVFRIEPVAFESFRRRLEYRPTTRVPFTGSIGRHLIDRVKAH